MGIKNLKNPWHFLCDTKHFYVFSFNLFTSWGFPAATKFSLFLIHEVSLAIEKEGKRRES